VADECSIELLGSPFVTVTVADSTLAGALPTFLGNPNASDALAVDDTPLQLVFRIKLGIERSDVGRMVSEASSQGRDKD
jgi:hypothetical protein